MACTGILPNCECAMYYETLRDVQKKLNKAYMMDDIDPKVRSRYIRMLNRHKDFLIEQLREFQKDNDETTTLLHRHYRAICVYHR